MDYKKTAQDNFAMWNEALQTKDPQKVAAMYAEENIFLPTVSPEFKKTVAEAAEYFEHFLAKNPNGEIKEEEVQTLGEGLYLHAGLYDFEIDGEGGRTVVEARFTYVWKMINDEWKITHHHSSVKPS